MTLSVVSRDHSHTPWSWGYLLTCNLGFSAQRGWVYSGHSISTHSCFSGALLGEALGLVVSSWGCWRGEQTPRPVGTPGGPPACTEGWGGKAWGCGLTPEAAAAASRASGVRS